MSDRNFIAQGIGIGIVVSAIGLALSLHGCTPQTRRAVVAPTAEAALAACIAAHVDEPDSVILKVCEIADALKPIWLPFIGQTRATVAAARRAGDAGAP